MYLPSHFKEDRPEILHGLMRSHPLGTLIVAGPDGVTADLLPFMLYTEEGTHGVLRAHAPRANPVCAALQACGAALVVFQGPQAYVSPNWYPSKQESHKVVPTWNYAMVQARCAVRVVDDGAWLRRQLDDLTGMQEARMPQPWRVADAPQDYITGISKALLGLELTITALDGKWKMSQNRSAPDQAGVVTGLRAQGGQAEAAVADLVAAAAAAKPA